LASNLDNGLYIKMIDEKMIESYVKKTSYKINKSQSPQPCYFIKNKVCCKNIDCFCSQKDDDDDFCYNEKYKFCCHNS